MQAGRPDTDDEPGLLTTNGNGIAHNVRPISNIYLEPSELIGGGHGGGGDGAIGGPPQPPVYDEVGKTVSGGSVNRNGNGLGKSSNGSLDQLGQGGVDGLLFGNGDECAPLLLSIDGGAVSVGNMAAPGEGASSMSSERISRLHSNNPDDYVEMSSNISRDSGLASLANGRNMSEENLKMGGATGTVKDTRPSNIYVSPMTVSDYVRENGKSVLGDKSSLQQVVPETHKKDNGEDVHIYCNSLDRFEEPRDPPQSSGSRPLPPVPH